MFVYLYMQMIKEEEVHGLGQSRGHGRERGKEEVGGMRQLYLN